MSPSARCGALRHAELQRSRRAGTIKEFLPRLRYAHRAANLGCVETVVGPPLVTSHVECTAEERSAAGIPEGLVRYSTGIEDVADLLDDLKQALAAIS